MEKIEEIKKEIRELQSKVDKLENQKKGERNEKRWRGRTSNKYFYVDDFGNVDFWFENNNDEDIYRYKARNYFKTEEEAEEYKQVINTYYDLMDLAGELNDGRKIDWEDGRQDKYSIYYSYDIDTLRIQLSFKCKDLGQIYCLDENFKEKAIKKIGEDRLKKLFKYERS